MDDAPGNTGEGSRLVIVARPRLRQVASLTFVPCVLTVTGLAFTGHIASLVAAVALVASAAVFCWASTEVVLERGRIGSWALAPEERCLYLLGGAGRSIHLVVGDLDWTPRKTWPASELESARAFAAEASRVLGLPVVEWFHPDSRVVASWRTHRLAGAIRELRDRLGPWHSEVLPRPPRRMLATVGGLKLAIGSTWLCVGPHVLTGSPRWVRRMRTPEVIPLGDIADAVVVVHGFGDQDLAMIVVTQRGGVTMLCECAVSRIARSPERAWVLGELEWAAEMIRHAARAEDPAVHVVPAGLEALRSA